MAAAVVLAGVGGAAWALGRDDGSGADPGEIGQVTDPEILTPADGTQVARGTPVDVSFAATVPEGFEVRLYVDGDRVDAARDGNTFTYVFSEPGERRVIVRLVDPRPDGLSYDSTGRSITVS